MIHKELRQAYWYRIKAQFRAKHTLNTYLYSALEAITKEISNAIGYEGELIYHIDNTPFSAKLTKNQTFEASIILPQISHSDALLWCDALHTYFQDPWNARNLELTKLEPPQLRQIDTLLSTDDSLKPNTYELCLDFLTPLPFTPKHPKKRTHIEAKDFFKLMLSRVERLFQIKLTLPVDEREYTILPYWNYQEYPVNSASQPASTRYINGCIGKLYLLGPVDKLTPLLKLCEEIHAGTSISYGRGYYQLLSGSVSALDPKHIEDTLRFYLAKNIDQSNPEFENTLSELYNSFLTAEYEPKPSEAFVPDGSTILTEKLHWTDRVIQSLIYKLLKNPIDNLIPLTVYSFRPHLSEQDLKKKVDELLNSGFDKVASLSFDGLFRKVNHSRLLIQLRQIIPKADHFIVELIAKFLKVGFIYNNQHHTSDRGLPLGSPFSSMLTNVYLLHVDKALNSEEVVSLRHVNNYLILSNSEEALERTISLAKTLLAELGYSVGKDNIKYLTETDITVAGVKIERKQKSEKLRKPLIITNPEFHLSVQSETVKISNSSGTVETIPLSRISEIVLYADTTLTSPLLRKLALSNIPVTISSDFNCPLLITRRDYKSHYESIFKHTLKYNSLSQDELLAFAKEIALLKIESYERLFTTKRHPQLASLLPKIKRAKLRITEATTPDAVRGYEATVAKENYRALNYLIRDSFFEIKTRQRENPDPVNSLMNLLSHVIFNKLRTFLHSAGLNPYLGFLHSPQNTYESLCADLQELLRARTDAVMLNIVNLRILSEKDFKDEDNNPRISSKGVKKVLDYLEEQLNRVVTPDGLSIYDFIYQQTQRIRNWAHSKEELRFEIPW